MKALTYNILLIIFFSFSIAKGQNNDINRTSELVFFNDQKLVSLLKDIIRKENGCQDWRKNINWYIDIKEEYKSIIITQGRLANLIELNEGKKRIYTTVINENIVFVIMKNKDEISLLDTGFSLDLSEFFNKSTLAFESFSTWLVEYDKGTYQLTNSHIRKCD